MMFRVRKIIHEKGMKIYNSIKDEDLKNLVGELLSLNEDRVLQNPETYGVQEILTYGFTVNQLKWIQNLKKKLEVLEDENEIYNKGD